MTELQPFTFPGTGELVRTVTIDGEPWFVARDVAAVLGYANGSRDVARHTTERQRREYRIGTPSGEQTVVLLNEPGVYRLIMRSNQPKAVDFQDWLAEVVLPSIRRTGSYGVEAPDWTPLDVARLYVAALEREQELSDKLAVAEPKAQAFDAFLNGSGCYLIDTVANLIGARHKALWNLLYDEKILIGKGSRKRQPYALDKTRGWFTVRTHDQEKTNGHAASTTYVTPYGAEQIRLLAVKRGLIQPQLLALTGGGDQ